jgi:hypothetical protein
MNGMLTISLGIDMIKILKCNIDLCIISIRKMIKIMSNENIIKFGLIIVIATGILLILIGVDNYNAFKNYGYTHKHTFDHHYYWQIPLGILSIIISTRIILHLR